MKKIIMTISTFSLIAMLSFGCTPVDTTKRNDVQDRGITNNGTTNGGTMRNQSTYDGYTRNNGTTDYSNLYNDWDNVTDDDGDINNNDNSYRNAQLGDTNKIASIKDVCNRKDNVEDTSVVINDDTCYVGLDLDNNANLSETMKEDLSNQIKRVDPSITKVYFTEDRGAIDNFVDSIDDSVDVDWNRLQNLFR